MSALYITCIIPKSMLYIGFEYTQTTHATCTHIHVCIATVAHAHPHIIIRIIIRILCNFINKYTVYYLILHVSIFNLCSILLHVIVNKLF